MMNLDHNPRGIFYVTDEATKTSQNFQKAAAEHEVSG